MLWKDGLVLLEQLLVVHLLAYFEHQNEYALQAELLSLYEMTKLRKSYSSTVWRLWTVRAMVWVYLLTEGESVLLGC